MIDKNKTVKQFASEMDIHYNSLRRIINEQATVRPRSYTYTVLADYFNKDENYLRSLPYNYSQLELNDIYE